MQKSLGAVEINTPRISLLYIENQIYFFVHLIEVRNNFTVASSTNLITSDTDQTRKKFHFGTSRVNSKMKFLYYQNKKHIVTRDFESCCARKH
ncbi:MAG: hypothetical protein A2499_16845 [Stygiobacter sp. RIFOXYC12_FULL_38_8]|nr:MAG: hypothetical protein A2X62_06965 [Stygiobacter sp. GWC2_38_9]OGU81581.1 MAG: hypothetical protein A2279_03470 [Stygiobacter sp. RIFOXYA12_FULL_38_9]OGV08310.1 MAG: hypothetical protein A2299_00015 [Stygiobacter sp. RIFOXYB2_FULL_37_11]OGV12137.1 MAG: hypothetical protein A2440_17665 [Stygiobacter sp. RIFOXYC2_FULL_38_25]OGV12184.1 MAG: hypothetical protein A2237_16070 [Stygiobacter sp. RIFOXYA2_FULL_38_8]OGV28774.1 MAG: hypothetical protein A2499_16845 [Stygiobacter sp. RIFOXYC12_FULL_